MGVKLLLSMLFLAQEKGCAKGAHLFMSTSLYTWLLYVVPSVLYAINNNLDMLNNQYMDPATEQVLVQLKILTTGLIWWVVFRTPLGAVKWFALLLLLIGCMGSSIPSSTTASDSGAKAMYIEPFGFILVGLYTLISATAGVYNEWLIKGPGKDESQHVCNMRIYTIGIIFLLFSHFAVNGGASGMNIFKGFNIYTWTLVFLYALMGLLIAQIVRVFDSIVKLFMSACSMYVSALAAFLIWGTIPSAIFFASLVLVTFAIMLYNKE